MIRWFGRVVIAIAIRILKARRDVIDGPYVTLTTSKDDVSAVVDFESKARAAAFGHTLAGDYQRVIDDLETIR